MKSVKKAIDPPKINPSLASYLQRPEVIAAAKKRLESEKAAKARTAQTTSVKTTPRPSNKTFLPQKSTTDFVKNVSIETGIDQLPYGNTIMGAKALNEGRPLTALSEFAKVPIGWVGDAAVNAAQENPTNYSIGKLEDKIIPAARLGAGSVTRLATGETPIITEIGKQIMTGGEKPDSKWYARNFNLPSLYEAAKMYGVDNNTFTKFVEDNWENSGKSYKKVLELAELKLRNKKK
jgi:hypothetical protein